jgi:predicted glycosyltransferase involved in capsule biosynthesis
MFTNFQSLAKLWNRGVLTASNDLCLVLNDDLTIAKDLNEKSFFDQLDLHIQNVVPKTTPVIFKINGSFSHFLISKSVLHQVGYFDERLLGIGEEDGDFSWRFHELFHQEIPSIDIPGILQPQAENGILIQESDEGFKKGIRHYSEFNRNFIHQEKYQKVLLGGYKRYV